MSTIGGPVFAFSLPGRRFAPLSVTPLLATLCGRYIVPGPDRYWGSGGWKYAG